MPRFAFANDIFPINPAERVPAIIRNIDPRAPLVVGGAVEDGDHLSIVQSANDTAMRCGYSMVLGLDRQQCSLHSRQIR
jgi:hypothetical protein